jgi:NodT family efflux transporter outer membrane factor (OMF) lipoprotein
MAAARFRRLSRASARAASLTAGLAASASAVLGGCTVGPRYAPPAMATAADQGFAAATTKIASADAPPPNWWRLYNAPALDALVQEALAHNKNLLVAAANLAYARDALAQARAGRYPSTQISAGAQYGITSLGQVTSQIETGRAASPAGYYTGGLDVSYELDLFGQIHRAVQAAAANVQAVQAAEDVTRISVAAETTRAYVNACAYAQELGVAQQSLDLVTQTYQVTVREGDAGAASEFDIARARALVEQTRATLPAYEGQRRTALFELAVLTGQPPEAISLAADACKAAPQLTTVLPVGDGRSLLRRRPDVRQAERQLASDVPRIGVATANLYPTITLGASEASSAVTLAGLATQKALTYGLGPALTWNFPNTAIAQAQIREARATASAAYANFQATVLQALQDMEEALTAYGSELDRNGALKAAQAQSAIAFRLAQVRYQDGEASYLDLISAETDLVNASAALAASNQAMASDQVTVFKALGGGWEQAPAVEPLPITDGRNGKQIRVH